MSAVACNSFIHRLVRWPITFRDKLIAHKRNEFQINQKEDVYSSDILNDAVRSIKVMRKNPLQWRHNECDGVSNHKPHDCLLNRLFRRGSKKTSKLRATGLCAGNSPMTGEFPAQRASNVENISIWWRHHLECQGNLEQIFCKFSASTLRLEPSTVDQWHQRDLPVYKSGRKHICYLTKGRIAFSS